MFFMRLFSSPSGPFLPVKGLGFILFNKVKKRREKVSGRSHLIRENRKNSTF